MELLILLLCLAFTALVLTILLYQDWPFIARPTCRVDAAVRSHQSSIEDSTHMFSAIFTFKTENGQPVEVRDAFYTARATPPVGALLPVVYPQGMPHKARISRPFVRVAIYAMMVYLATVLSVRIYGLL